MVGCVPAQPCDVRQFSTQSVEREQLRLCSATRQHGVFFRLYEGRTPECYNRIADEFIHDAVMLLDRESLQTEVSVEQRHHEQRSQPFR